MSENKPNNRPLAAYAVVSQISFIVLTPLLFFSIGGTWIADKFGLPDFMKAVFVLLGVFTMLAALISYLMKLMKLYGDVSDEHKPEKNKYLKYSHDRKDYDFYDDNIKKRL